MSTRRFLILAGSLISIAVGLRAWYAWGTSCLDEGIYLLVGQRILSGGMLYVTVPEGKPPVFFLFNMSAVILLQGDLYLASIFVGVLCGLIAILVYQVALLLWNSRPAALAAGLIFAIF